MRISVLACILLTHAGTLFPALQVSLEALVVLLEEKPPTGVMPQLGITCLRLAGRALLPREGKGKQDEGPTARVSASSRIPAIQVGRLRLSIMYAFIPYHAHDNTSPGIHFRAYVLPNEGGTRNENGRVGRISSRSVVHRRIDRRLHPLRCRENPLRNKSQAC